MLRRGCSKYIVYGRVRGILGRVSVLFIERLVGVLLRYMMVGNVNTNKD